MKRSGIFLAALTALTMAGCQKVPEDVKSRAEGQSAAASEPGNEPARTDEIRFISPDDLEADVSEGLGKTYQSFTLAEGIKVELPESFTVCDFKQTTGFNKKADMLLERYFGRENAENLNVFRQEKNADNPNLLSFSSVYDNEMAIQCLVQANGHMLIYRNAIFDLYAHVGSRVAEYHVDRGDDLSDRYDLEGRELSVAEAVDAAQKWLDDKYADLEPEYDIRIKTVIARLDEFGEYSLGFTAVRIYKGIALDDLCMVCDNAPEDELHVKYFALPITIITKNGTDMDYLDNTGIVKPQEKGKLEKVVSLESALAQIDKLFADKEHFTINDIGLKYILRTDYDPKDHLRGYCEENAVNTGHIVWEFVIDVPPEEIDITDYDETGDCADVIGDVHRYIYIDAETGEAEYEFDLENQLRYGIHI